MSDSPTTTGPDAGTKVTTAADAVATITDGDHIAIGGCLYSRTPMALLLEVLRQGAKDLTLSRSLMCYESELFFAAGQLRAIETSWVGFGGRWGMLPIVRGAIEQGALTYHEYSHLGIAMRYHAGAMGVPFLPMRSMLGADLLGRTEAIEAPCPFTGEPLVAVPANQPDVALIHAHRGDDRGNVQIDGYQHMDFDIARAAKRVIVTVEEIVGRDRIEREPDRTVIPHFVVDAIVEAPRGAAPHEMYGLYDADFEHFDDYASLTRESGMDGARTYLERFVHGTRDHDAFLASFPADRHDRSRARVEELL